MLFGTDSQMDIQDRGIQGFVTHEGFDRHKVDSVLIKMGAESMTKCMAGDPVRPSKLFLVGMDVSGDKEGIDRTGIVRLLGEEPAFRLSAGKPIISENG